MEIISPWTVYVIGKLSDVRTISVFVALACLFGLMIAILGYVTNDPEVKYERRAYEISKKWLPKLWAALVLFGLLAVAVPSTKLAASMYIIPAIANNEDLQKIGGNSLKALRELTEQWVREVGDVGNNGKTDAKEL